MSQTPTPAPTPPNFNEFSETLLASSSEHLEYLLSQFQQFLSNRERAYDRAIHEKNAMIEDMRRDMEQLRRDASVTRDLLQRERLEWNTALKRMESENFFLRRELTDMQQQQRHWAGVQERWAQGGTGRSQPPPSYSISPQQTGHMGTNSALSHQGVKLEYNKVASPVIPPTGASIAMDSSPRQGGAHASTLMSGAADTNAQHRHLHHTTSPLLPPNVAESASYITSPSTLVSSSSVHSGETPQQGVAVSPVQQPTSARHPRTHSSSSNGSSSPRHHAPSRSVDQQQHLSPQVHTTSHQRTSSQTSGAPAPESPSPVMRSRPSTAVPRFSNASNATSSPPAAISTPTHTQHRQRPQTASVTLSPSSRADLQKYSHIEVGSAEFLSLNEYEQKLVLKHQEAYVRGEDESTEQVIEEVFSRRVQHPDQKFLPTPPLQTSNSSPTIQATTSVSRSTSRQRSSTPNRLRSTSNSSRRSLSNQSNHSVRSSPARRDPSASSVLNSSMNRRASFGGNSSLRFNREQASVTHTPATPKSRRHSIVSRGDSSAAVVRSPSSADSSSSFNASFHTNTLGGASSAAETSSMSFNSTSSKLTPFYFNPSCTHLDLDLTNANRTISHKKNNIWRSSLANICMSSGIHEFTFLIEENTSGHQLRIGIADYDFDLSLACGDSALSYAIELKNGGIYNNRNEKQYYSGKIRKNARITVIVDLNNYQLSYRLNGENLGVACSLKKKTKFYPCVSMYGLGSSVSFVA